MKTILAPVDFSSVSDAVVSSASRLARAFEGRLVLLSIVQPPVMMSEFAPLMENIAEFVATCEKNARRRLGQIEEKLSTDFGSCESVVKVGSPVQQILDAGQEMGADYIVMGSHGHTALYDLIVGSTTHGVLLRANCPVLIVPAAKSAGEQKSQKKSRALA
jgi:nucleotide-binding universal stress UspA family protein